MAFLNGFSRWDVPFEITWGCLIVMGVPIYSWIVFVRANPKQKIDDD